MDQAYTVGHANRGRQPFANCVPTKVSNHSVCQQQHTYFIHVKVNIPSV